VAFLIDSLLPFRNLLNDIHFVQRKYKLANEFLMHMEKTTKSLYAFSFGL